MTDEDETVMQQYGITAEHKTVYRFGKYTYDHLSDAASYAKESGSEAADRHAPSPVRDEQ